MFYLYYVSPSLRDSSVPPDTVDSGTTGLLLITFPEDVIHPLFQYSKIIRIILVIILHIVCSFVTSIPLVLKFIIDCIITINATSTSYVM